MKRDEKRGVYSLIGVLGIALLACFMLVSIVGAASATAITQVTNCNSGGASKPAIYDDRMVWADNRNGDFDVFMYDFSTFQETRITTNTRDQLSPVFYGDKIIWNDNRDNVFNNYMYDLSTSIESKLPGEASSPHIYSDKVLWARSTLNEYNLYIYNLSTQTETQVPNSGGVNYANIYGNRIVWDETNGDHGIHVYDLFTSQSIELPLNTWTHRDLDIYEDKIVYATTNNIGKSDIYMYDLSTHTETQISHSGRAYTPAIYGGRIVWEDDREYAKDNIYIYDLFTQIETQITTQGSAMTPDIYGDRIVWMENHNGFNMYTCTIPVGKTKATPTITWSNPEDIIYGTSLNSTQLNAVSSVPGTFVYTPLAGTVLNAGTQTLRADFTPTDTANYNITSMNITINVLKATPIITWNNPADIVAGAALNSTQLNAVASVPGTFSYTPSSGTILNAGTHTLRADFTPSDSANYTTASKDVTINVVAAPLKNPTITWSNPKDIIYGTSLSSTQLNAVSSVPGTFVYTPAAGTVLSAGTQTLHVDFTPTDTANYNTASADVTINVLKATPTITWNNSADIVAGTVLSSTQLNAVASVPGTLIYTPPLGTVLSAGTQTLKADFTPTDIANYNTATQTVTINVLTHVQGIQQITTEVQSLNLVPEQANLLIVKLDTATKNLNNGITLGAATELNAFTNQVNAFINNGKISSSEGQALIDDTNDLIKAMDNIFNFPAASVPEFPSVALPVVAILGLVMIFGRKKE